MRCGVCRSRCLAGEGAEAGIHGSERVPKGWKASQAVTSLRCVVLSDLMKIQLCLELLGCVSLVMLVKAPVLGTQQLRALLLLGFLL